jgi:peptide deformylase
VSEKMKLVDYQDPILAEVVPEFTGIPASLREAAVAMYEIMSDPQKPGVGIAAPQVALRVRMFVMNLIPPRVPGRTHFVPRGASKGRTFANSYVCINPVIREMREPVVGSVEGCLTRPGMAWRRMRSSEIRAEWTDLVGKRRRETLFGTTAVCFQHELDHLDGVTLWAPRQLAQAEKVA